MADKEALDFKSRANCSHPGFPVCVPCACNDSCGCKSICTETDRESSEWWDNYLQWLRICKQKVKV